MWMEEILHQLIKSLSHNIIFKVAYPQDFFRPEHTHGIQWIAFGMFLYLPT